MVSFSLTTVASVLPLLLSSLSLSLGLVGATPISARQSSASVSVTFIGAADGQYTLDVPLDSVFTPTNNALSVSHISTVGAGPCVFFGVDGAVYVSPPAGGEGDVGPPQTIAGGICGPFPGHQYGMW
ncbi:hypothetical protein A1O3_07277 [Capronia epimyces CBS 606.96]|uniref:Uncharacterized protein n=1 Tax=Capronia epimyces CBS 606.96 TaxID=1182542 RepID=W9YFB2_9EURO|nr:uncharacterized protein A1O3_07277 [Capronia epimyces CBS 606.96]EXJ80989.1 hypothetical protein A1O3_07277 [Capronia epimyces CBS 606.96]